MGVGIVGFYISANAFFILLIFILQVIGTPKSKVDTRTPILSAPTMLTITLIFGKLHEGAGALAFLAYGIAMTKTSLEDKTLGILARKFNYSILYILTMLLICAYILTTFELPVKFAILTSALIHGAYMALLLRTK
jgi:hypothetical protein